MRRHGVNFRKFVASRYGSLRMTSLAVEEAIKCFNAVGLLRSFSNAIGLVTGVYPSVREVEERRPKLGTLAGEEVRGMSAKLVYLDTSSIVKRYVEERGSKVVDAVYARLRLGS
jgi:hypothetical protein